MWKSILRFAAAALLLTLICGSCGTDVPEGKTDNTQKPADNTVQASGESVPVPRKKGGSWIFVDASGKQVSPCEYEFAGEFSEGFAIVSGGIIDQKFEMLPVGELDNTRSIWVCANFSEGYAVVCCNRVLESYYGIVSTDGAFRKLDYNASVNGLLFNFSRFHNGLVVVCLSAAGPYASAKYYNGVINTDGENILDVTGAEIYGCGLDGNNQDILLINQLIAVKREGKWALFNRDGKQITEFRDSDPRDGIHLDSADPYYSADKRIQVDDGVFDTETGAKVAP